MVPAAVLDAMTDVMTHRGPNDRGTYLDEGVALGVRRLSIVDTEGGHQPLANERGDVWAIQNGELYNHLEVRKRLRSGGHVFRTQCDREIRPHMYEQFGRMVPDRSLRYNRARCLGRRRAVEPSLPRDRLVIKPIYLALRCDFLVFASEFKSAACKRTLSSLTSITWRSMSYSTLRVRPRAHDTAAIRVRS